MADNPKSKIAIVSICSLLLVAMVVALFTIKQENGNTDGEDVSASQKSIATLCQNTDYQETCVNSLKSKDTTDPKELIEYAFQVTIKEINQAANNSTLFHELDKDPRAKSALDSCRELADRAANDLNRSFAKFSHFDLVELDHILSDLKIWLSGAITYQETCLDGFEDVEGDAGEKMKEHLTLSMQLTSNGLAMVTGISSVLQSIDGLNTNSRRLLSEDVPIVGHGDDDMPEWIDSNRRKLLQDKIKADVVVAKDGSGNYTTITEALSNIAKKSNKTIVLYIKEGVYEEKVNVNSSITHLLMIGDGPTKTKITGNLNFIDGTNTYRTATVAVQGDHFTARDIGFENSAGPEKHQAVALRVSADRAIFYNCQMDGYQDTLYAHTYRQYYRDCIISGTIDFIFGDSAAVFQGCTMLVRKPLSNQNCIVTAQGRKDARQPTGLVIQNCSFVADPAYLPVSNTSKSYLARPWKEFSRTIIMESFIDEFIQPEGYLPWNQDFALDTLFYAEFNNRGPAAAKDNRVKWGGIKELPAARIKRFTANAFIDGARWIKPKNIPYDGDFIFSVPKEDPNAKYSSVEPVEDKDLGGGVKDKSSFYAQVPVSQIASSPLKQPYAPAPEGNSHAPALSPVSQPQPDNDTDSLSAFKKLFSVVW